MSTRPSTSPWTSSRSSRPSRGCATRGRCSWARARPNRPATTRPAPTMSFRPAASRARRAAVGRGVRTLDAGPARHRDGLAAIRDRRGAGGSRRPGRAPRRRSRRFEGPEPEMCPTPSLRAPRPATVYTWEPPNEQVAARYGLPSTRSSASTSTPRRPAGPRRASGRAVRPAAQRVPRQTTRLTEAAADRTASTPTRSSWARAPTRSSTHREDVPPGRPRPCCRPDVRDVRGAHRAARRESSRVPRRRRRGLGARRRRAPRGRARVPRRVAVQPEQPHRPGRARRHDRSAPRGSRRDAGRRRAADRRRGRGLRRVRPDVARRRCASATRGSSSCARSRRPSRWPGCASAMRSPARVIARMNPYRPPGRYRRSR